MDWENEKHKKNLMRIEFAFGENLTLLRGGEVVGCERKTYEVKREAKVNHRRRRRRRREREREELRKVDFFFCVCFWKQIEGGRRCEYRVWFQVVPFFHFFFQLLLLLLILYLFIFQKQNYIDKENDI